jgi:UDP-N-acetylglucosamine 2-epimerase (non-hydrolysing)
LFASLAKATATGHAQKSGADGSHVVVTLHRPSNVDDPDRLRVVCAELAELAKSRPVFFPAHPRTQQQLKALDIDTGKVRLSDPISYFEMLDLVQSAHAVVTDSGGLQEETTALGVPCFTLRQNTERPITIAEGTNQLVLDLSTLGALVNRAVRPETAKRPLGWDGLAGQRVARALADRP